MSERLYYEDAYTTRFAAKIIERVRDSGRLAVVLDKTYFYPTSGGQPHDRGLISGVPVADVTIRDGDGAVLHWLEGGEPAGGKVAAEIDWPRRFDHMQQHTGQHILSQAFLRVAAAETVGFHLSDKSVTIDLDADNLTAAQVQEAEELANEIVWQNRSIHVQTVTPAQAKKLPLRKVPPVHDGHLRLIDIQDFDLTACGGTHVTATGSVGIIKVLRLERRGDHSRVEFNCGWRALRDYRQKNDLVNRLTTELTTGAGDVIAAVSRLQAEASEARRTVRKQQAQLLRLEAAALRQEGSRHDDVTIVTRVFTDKDPAQLRLLANHLIEEQGTIVLLGLSGSKTHLVFSRSAGAPGNVNRLLKTALEMLGSGSGGGSASFAQGGGPAVTQEKLQDVLIRVEKGLVNDIWSN